MRRTVAIIGLILSALLAACTSSELPPPKLATYTNDAYGFSFAYPEHWEVNRTAGAPPPPAGTYVDAGPFTITVAAWNAPLNEQEQQVLAQNGWTRHAASVGSAPGVAFKRPAGQTAAGLWQRVYLTRGETAYEISLSVDDPKYADDGFRAFDALLASWAWRGATGPGGDPIPEPPEDARAPHLVKSDFGELWKEQDSKRLIHVLPQPATFRFEVANTEDIRLKLYAWADAGEASPPDPPPVERKGEGVWEVAWQNPPVLPVMLEVLAAVAPDLPDHPSYRSEDGLRWKPVATAIVVRINEGVRTMINRERAIETARAYTPSLTPADALLILPDSGSPVWKISMTNPADGRPAGSITVDASSGEVQEVSSPPSGQ